jgi:hypothetical protein
MKYKKVTTSENWREVKLQSTFTTWWINHPGLKVGYVFTARQNNL